MCDTKSIYLSLWGWSLFFFSIVPQLGATPPPFKAIPFLFQGTESMRVQWISGGLSGGLFVEIYPHRSEGKYAFARRTMQNWKENFKQIPVFQDKQVLQPNVFIQLPFHVLKKTIQGASLKALFPKDKKHDTEKALQHHVLYSWEKLSLILKWFTQNKATLPELLVYNIPSLKKDKSLQKGDQIRIPWQWISPELGLKSFPEEPPLYLRKGKQDDGFVIYRIQKGESLYSSVIIRFTTRTLSQKRASSIKQLLELNQISDPRHIKEGQEIQIPIAWLSKKYRPSFKKEKTSSLILSSFAEKVQTPLKNQNVTQSENATQPLPLSLPSPPPVTVKLKKKKEVTLSPPVILSSEEVENNDSVFTANIIVNNKFRGRIGEVTQGLFDSSDYFKYVLEQNGDLNFKVVHDRTWYDSRSPYAQILLYDSTGKDLIRQIAMNASGRQSFTETGLSAGTYVIKVYSSVPYRYGAYKVALSVTQTSTNVTESEPNDTIDTANIIQNHKFSGSIGYKSSSTSFDSSDYFKYVLKQDGDLHFQVTHDRTWYDSRSPYAQIQLYDSKGDSVILQIAMNASGRREGTETGLAAGTYFIRVYSNVPYRYGSYAVQLNVSPAANKVTEHEPNDVRKNAVLIRDNQFSGTIGYKTSAASFDSSDYFLYVLDQAGDLSFQVTHDTTWYDSESPYAEIQLYDITGKLIIRAPMGVHGEEWFTITGLLPKAYYIRVYSSVPYRYGAYKVELTPNKDPFLELMQ